MANQYRSVLASSGPAPTGGDALPAEVLSGKTFTNDNGAQTGTMTNNGAISQNLTAGQSYTIPEGYHNGNGIITAVSIEPYYTGNSAEDITGMGSLTVDISNYNNITFILGQGANSQLIARDFKTMSVSDFLDTYSGQITMSGSSGQITQNITYSNGTFTLSNSNNTASGTFIILS